VAQVACLGILVADLLCRPVDRYPERGELVLVDEMSLHTGGCAANTGVDLVKIGIETAVLGKVGNDGLGDFVRSKLGATGINTQGIVVDPVTNTSGTSVLVFGDGERSFVHYIGANATYKVEDVAWDVIEGAKILHVAGHFLMPGFDGAPCAQVMKEAQQRGLVTTLDTAGAPRPDWGELITPVLPYVDYALPSENEAQVITGQTDVSKIADWFLERGVKCCGLKRGGEGSYLKTADGQEISKPIFRVNAFDTTGSGDAFVAGFLTGLVMGWSLEDTLTFGNATGAICATYVGATAGMKTLAELQDFIKTTPMG
jgi:sugar/nucleoside kinase (ribokinase family)